MKISRSPASAGSGTSVARGTWYSLPASTPWKDTDISKITSEPPSRGWLASTRRVVNERPSRVRSTS
jgi:hypothetical protein